MSFKRVNAESPVIKALADSELLSTIKTLLAQSNWNLQFREDYLNFYYKMGNVLRISCVNGKLQATIHHKYIPSFHEKGDQAQVPCEVSGGTININQSEQAKLTRNYHDLLHGENITKIKSLIALYAGKEKEIQAKIIDENEDTVLDAEAQFGGNDQKRVDLINFEPKNNSIMPVELKLIDDNRLYSGEYIEQLGWYKKLFQSHESELLEAYTGVVQAKLRLGLITNDSDVSRGIQKGINIQAKPLLLIVVNGTSKNQDRIDLFKNSLFFKNKLSQLKEICSGVYFYGKAGKITLSNSENKMNFSL